MINVSKLYLNIFKSKHIHHGGHFMNKKILVVFTGGTIGSTLQDGFIAPNAKKGYHLIDEYRRISPYLIFNDDANTKSQCNDKINLQIDTIEPYRILSENLNGVHINSLIKCISKYVSAKDAVSHNYDGIIITHGTDTLQYTSAAVGYAFSDVNIPIVMISSNYILDDKRANGHDNFYYAVEFITKVGTPGVFVSYRNGKTTQLIHRSTRLLPHMPYDDLVYSVGNMYYGEFVASEFVKKDNLPYANSGNYNPDDIHLQDTSPILFIRSLPGQSYPVIGDNIKAILFDSYHSGTIDTADEAIYNFTNEAKNKKIPVFLTGAENRTEYESTKVYNELGIHVLPKASPIAMYMKLWLLSSIEGSDIYKDMYKTWGSDFIEDSPL